MKKLILSFALALLSSGLFAQQVIERSGMRILSLKRNTSNGNANNFEFKISDNVNGVNVIAKRSLSITATQNAADIALLANPGQTNPQFLLKANGNVGIGTTNPGSYKLAVEGRIGAREVDVKTSSWADFVFAKDYALPTLDEVDAYIQEHHHLPDVPSEAEVLKEGIHLGEMQKVLLQKVEELTLYTIDLQEQLRVQQQEIEQLKADR